MLRSKILKLAKVKYFFTLLASHTFLALFAIDNTILCRIITDLHLKKLSYNEIREHIRLIYHIDVTKHKIKEILRIAGKKAKEANKKLDREICSKINTIEVDEVFQGTKRIILGAAEKKSQYLLSLKPAANRTSKSLSCFLKPLSKRFFNVRVVITDLFKAYKKVIPKIFKKARHLACHIHLRRDSLKFLEKMKNRWKKLKKKRDSTEKAILILRKKIVKLTTQKKDLEQLIHKDRQNRQDLKLKKRRSKSGKTKTVDKRLKAIKERLIRRSEKYSTIKRQIEKARKKRDEDLKEIRRLTRNTNKLFQDFMQSSRIHKRFFDILTKKGRKFKNEFKTFKISLENTRYSYGKHLLKQITANPQIFALRKSTDMSENFQNTNTIERIFGILRPRLDSSRLFQTSEGAESYCELFRLYYNTTPRYTGMHTNSSPFTQLGGVSTKSSYLDYLFPTSRRTYLLFGDEKLNLHFSGTKIYNRFSSSVTVCA